MDDVLIGEGDAYEAEAKIARWRDDLPANPQRNAVPARGGEVCDGAGV